MCFFFLFLKTFPALSSGGNPALETVGGGCVFGLDPFSTSSHSGINTLKEIHLSWKMWRAALLSAAANFPHLPVVLLTTPPTLPRSKAALWRRQEGSGAKQRCAHKAGGGERSILKAHGCSGGLCVAVFKAVLLCFLAGISAFRAQWRRQTGTSRRSTTGVCSCPPFSCFISYFQTSHSALFP